MDVVDNEDVADNTLSAGEDSANITADEKAEGITATPTPEEEKDEGRPVSEEAVDVGKMTVFEQFESALNAAGITYETVRMAAELIGAEEGVKYKIDDSSVELYLFDKESEAYKTAEANQSVTMEGFGDIAAMVENGMCLFINGLNEDTYLVLFRDVHN